MCILLCEIEVDGLEARLAKTGSRIFLRHYLAVILRKVSELWSSSSDESWEATAFEEGLESEMSHLLWRAEIVRVCVFRTMCT